jgi:hypothetical protein
MDPVVSLAWQVNSLFLDANARQQFTAQVGQYVQSRHGKPKRPPPLPVDANAADYDSRKPPLELPEQYAILAALHFVHCHQQWSVGQAQEWQSNAPLTLTRKLSRIERSRIAWHALVANAEGLGEEHISHLAACLEAVQKDLAERAGVRSEQAPPSADSTAALATGPLFRQTPTMEKILSACRKKHYKGEVLANKIGLEYNYARKLFSKLVKAGKLKNDPQRGYRAM